MSAVALKIAHPSEPRSGGNRFWIEQGLHFTNVPQAGFKLSSNQDEVLSTVLGSCVAVCVRDPITGCGGMNHFLLPMPEDDPADIESVAMRYGSFAIERMVNQLIAGGAYRQRLEIKVFGGANMFDGSSKIGTRNADFVEEYLGFEGFRILASDLRGTNARKVRYRPFTGEAWVKKLNRHDDAPFINEQLVSLDKPKTRIDLF